MAVGAALATAADDPSVLLAAADAALYLAKNSGCGHWQLGPPIGLPAR